MIPALSIDQISSPILVVAPHPDDEILSAGGLIQRALQKGKAVYVLYMTVGDASVKSVRHYLHAPLRPSSFIRLGQLRHTEAVRSTQSLGIPNSHLFFLGFPDRSLLTIAGTGSPFTIIRSNYTKLISAAYPFAYVRGALYTRNQVISLTQSVISRVKPRTIIVNHPADIHPDHRAARLIVLAALKRMHYQADIYNYLIHYPHWPSATGELNPPARLLSGNVRRFKLTVLEQRKKRTAFGLDRSQATANSYLYKLIRSSELYWRSNPAKKNDHFWRTQI